MIAVDDADFPTDRYVVDGIARTRGCEVRHGLDDLEGVDVVLRSLVDYRTAEMADLAAETARAGDAGATIVWDLSHAVGVVDLDLATDDGLGKLGVKKSDTVELAGWGQATDPVMKEASGEARKVTVLAISSGRAMRASGMAVSLARHSGDMLSRSSMAVSVGPGATQFTRISGASASALSAAARAASKPSRGHTYP